MASCHVLSVCLTVLSVCLSVLCVACSLACCSFRLGKGDDDERSKSHKAYAFVSKFKDAKRTIRMGILPWGPVGGDRENGPRGANFITLPGHPVWDLKTAEEVRRT